MRTFLIHTSIFGVFSFGILTANAQENYTDNENIITLIEKKREYNRKNGAGFKIQLYNGTEKKARATKYRFKREFRWINTKLEFESPDWKVQVGDYQTKLDADRALNKFRGKFSSAIIIQK